MAAHGKKPVSVIELEKAAAKLQKQAKVILDLRDTMKSTGQKSVTAMGFPMVTRADDSINRFILSLKRELGEL